MSEAERQIPEEERIIKVNIEDEMRTSYIDYSMSVIVSRALPDVRDGFKPVQRRILFGMKELGNTFSQKHKKSARIVGDVMGKYHPHGDSSIYLAMVRMGQEWAMRYRLVDGQGNFGSVDGDSPAAMRYTEVRLTRMGEEMMGDIDKDTVDFVDNYDGTRKEPFVLPSKFPNLLLNGTSGIAVGMATNMPPHNLSEAVDACVAYIDNNDITTDELMEFVKGPDFPTGGLIYGIKGVKDAYETGHGRVVIRGKAEIESERNSLDKIVIYEIPYNVNKSELVKNIYDLGAEKKVEGIAAVRDESDKDGMRIVVEVKSDANANVVLNKLYKMTALQSSFGVNNIALVPEGSNPFALRPKLLTLKDIIASFVKHRHEVVIRRTKYDLNEAEKRAHILQGLIIASQNIDEVIALIRAAKTPQEAIEALKARFDLTQVQATEIVEMRLKRLTGLEQDKLHAEYEEKLKLIEYLKQILSDDELCRKIIKDELIEVKEKYGDARKSEIMYASEELNPEDFYADDKMVITISHLGYIKRTPLSEFKAQNRGGVGSKGSQTRDEDFVEYIYPATMHNTIMFFTQKGKCYWKKVYEIPEGTKQSKGRAIQNLLNIDSGDSITAFVRVKTLNDAEYINSHYLLFCTQKGIVKKTSLEQYSRPRANGVNAITIHEDDKVIGVRLTDGTNEIIIANRNGRAIRFNEAKVRSMGRTAAGVKGITLDDDGQDEVVGMVCIKDQERDTVLVVSEQGYGKRSSILDYRITNRGAKGVKTLNVTEKTGKLVSIKAVKDDNDLMIINKSGIAIRVKVADLRVMGRATQGVKLINLEKHGDHISSVCKVDSEVEEIDEVETEGTSMPDAPINSDKTQNT